MPKLQENGYTFCVYIRKDRGDGKTYYFRYEDTDSSPQRSTGSHRKEEAIALAREFLRTLPPKPVRKPGIERHQASQMSQGISSYLPTKTMLLRPSTASTVTRHLKRLCEGLGDPYFHKITPDMVKTFATRYYHKVEPAASQWRDTLHRWEEFFKWAVKTRRMSQNPLEGYPRPRMDQIHTCDEVWDPFEFQTLLEVCRKDDQDVLMVLRYIGILEKDCFTLKKKHFFRDAEGILCLAKKRAKARYSSQVYKQPIDPRVEPLIEAKLASCASPESRLFGTAYENTDKGYLAWYIAFWYRVNRRWKKHFPDRKPKEPKALRHTFATEHIERGVPEDVLLEWMGHSPGSTVLRRHYLHRKSTARYRYVPDAPASPPALLHQ